MRSGSTIALLLAALLLVGVATAQDEGTTMFVPIGGGYGDTYDGFIGELLDHAPGSAINITVLPATYATDAESISPDELQENLDAAENRRAQIEEACLAGVLEGMTCTVTLAPVFVRADAENPDNLAFFGDDLTAVYILGGDQTIAMRVLANTPLEDALEAAYQRGVVIAGTSAGEAVQSRAMIAGYVGDYGPESGLLEGSVEVWNGNDLRGLRFGLTDIIFEQHFWERARLGRLLNVLAQPGVPGVGIAIDSYTAAIVTDETTLGGVFGLYSLGIFDAETLGAKESAAFRDGVLSIRNVLFHILPPGVLSYDLTTRQPSLAATPTEVERDFSSLRIPDGAGTLILNSGGNLEPSTTENPNPVIDRFRAALPGDNPTIWVIGSEQLASGEDLAGELTDDVAGIIVSADDQSMLSAANLAFLKDAWLAGTPLLLDNAAAALAGQFFSAQGPIPEATDDDPFADVDYIQGALIDGNTDIQPGLGLLDATVEPRVLADYRVGRLVALAYAHPDLLALGLNDGAALEITPEGAAVIGANGVFVLDLRTAALDKGSNDAYAFANGLLDVFAPGETIE